MPRVRGAWHSWGCERMTATRVLRCIKSRTVTIRILASGERPRLARVAIPIAWSRETFLAYVLCAHEHDTIELVTWGAGIDSAGEPLIWLPNPEAFADFATGQLA